jgi:hypothetical protein
MNSFFISLLYPTGTRYFLPISDVGDPSPFFFQISNPETPNAHTPLAGASLQVPQPSDYRHHVFPFSWRDEADH